MKDVHVGPIGDGFDGNGIRRYGDQRAALGPLFSDGKVHLLLIEGIGGMLFVVIVRFDEASQDLGSWSGLPAFGESDLQRLVQIAVLVVFVKEEDLHALRVWFGLVLLVKK